MTLFANLPFSHDLLSFSNAESQLLFCRYKSSHLASMINVDRGSLLLYNENLNPALVILTGFAQS